MFYDPNTPPLPIPNTGIGKHPETVFHTYPTIIKRSEIQAMTSNEYRARRDEIRKAMADGRIVDDTDPNYRPNSFLEPIKYPIKDKNN